MTKERFVLSFDVVKEIPQARLIAAGVVLSDSTADVGKVFVEGGEGVLLAGTAGEEAAGGFGLFADVAAAEGGFFVAAHLLLVIGRVS